VFDFNDSLIVVCSSKFQYNKSRFLFWVVAT